MRAGNYRPGKAFSRRSAGQSAAAHHSPDIGRPVLLTLKRQRVVDHHSVRRTTTLSRADRLCGTGTTPARCLTHRSDEAGELVRLPRECEEAGGEAGKLKKVREPWLGRVKISPQAPKRKFGIQWAARESRNGVGINSDIHRLPSITTVYQRLDLNVRNCQ